MSKTPENFNTDLSFQNLKPETNAVDYGFQFAQHIKATKTNGANKVVTLELTDNNNVTKSDLVNNHLMNSNFVFDSEGQENKLVNYDDKFPVVECDDEDVDMINEKFLGVQEQFYPVPDHSKYKLSGSSQDVVPNPECNTTEVVVDTEAKPKNNSRRLLS
jgi:hypothetical protein